MGAAVDLVYHHLSIIPPFSDITPSVPRVCQKNIFTYSAWISVSHPSSAKHAANATIPGKKNYLHASSNLIDFKSLKTAIILIAQVETPMQNSCVAT